MLPSPEVLAYNTVHGTDLLRSVTGFWYVATPYSKYPGGLDRAFDDTLDVVSALMRENVLVFSPIVHCHDIAKRKALGTTHDFWRNYNEGMIRAASGVLAMTMPGWERSVGLADERAYAASLGKPVLYMDPETAGVRIPAYPAQVYPAGGSRVVVMFPDFTNIAVSGTDERDAFEQAAQALGIEILSRQARDLSVPPPCTVVPSEKITMIPVPQNVVRAMTEMRSPL